MPNAGDPFARALARLAGKMNIPLIKWEEGGRRGIASPVCRISPTVRKVLLVDDLITKADSKREAIEVLWGEGLQVSDVLVLADREQGGDEELSKVDSALTLHSVFTVTELFGLYASAGRISPQVHAGICSYLASEKRQPSLV